MIQIVKVIHTYLETIYAFYNVELNLLQYIVVSPLLKRLVKLFNSIIVFWIWCPDASVLKSPTQLLKTYYPAELGSNPNQTDLNQLINIFRIEIIGRCVEAGLK